MHPHGSRLGTADATLGCALTVPARASATPSPTAQGDDHAAFATDMDAIDGAREPTTMMTTMGSSAR